MKTNTHFRSACVVAFQENNSQKTPMNLISNSLKSLLRGPEWPNRDLNSLLLADFSLCLNKEVLNYQQGAALPWDIATKAAV